MKLINKGVIFTPKLNVILPLIEFYFNSSVFAKVIQQWILNVFFFYFLIWLNVPKHKEVHLHEKVLEPVKETNQKEKEGIEDR